MGQRVYKTELGGREPWDGWEEGYLRNKFRAEVKKAEGVRKAKIQLSS